jgi:hypothetical protein
MPPLPKPAPATNRDNPQPTPVESGGDPAVRSTVGSTGQLPEGHVQGYDGQDLGLFPAIPPNTPIHRLPINIRRIIHGWFDENVALDQIAYLLHFHFKYTTSPSAVCRYHTRLRQETAHREAAVLVAVVRELADEQVLGSKPDTAAAREELRNLKEIMALDRDDIHGFVALSRLRLDEREAVVHERLAAVRERQIALDERLAELRLHPASAPGAKSRNNPPTPPEAQAPQPAQAAGTGARDSSSRVLPPAVHPILPNLARRRRGAKTCKVPQAAPPASPVLNEQPAPNPIPPCAAPPASGAVSGASPDTSLGNQPNSVAAAGRAVSTFW